MNKEKNATAFWDGEKCEYCGRAVVEKVVVLHRRVNGHDFIFEHVPAGVCKQCGARYYAANVLKRVEEHMRGGRQAEREVLVPVYSI